MYFTCFENCKISTGEKRSKLRFYIMLTCNFHDIFVSQLVDGHEECK